MNGILMMVENSVRGKGKGAPLYVRVYISNGVDRMTPVTMFGDNCLAVSGSPAQDEKGKVHYNVVLTGIDSPTEVVRRLRQGGYEVLRA